MLRRLFENPILEKIAGRRIPTYLSPTFAFGGKATLKKALQFFFCLRVGQ